MSRPRAVEFPVQAQFAEHPKTMGVVTWSMGRTGGLDGRGGRKLFRCLKNVIYRAVFTSRAKACTATVQYNKVFDVVNGFTRGSATRHPRKSPRNTNKTHPYLQPNASNAAVRKGKSLTFRSCWL